MSTTGNLDLETSAEGKAGSPGDVATSKNNQDTPGASASGAEKTKETEKPKETGAVKKSKLPPPTSIVEENKQ